MRTHQLILSLCALTLAGACDDDEGPKKLFEEEGTWALNRYDLGQGIMPLNLSEQIDQFLINFNAEAQIVTTAACIDMSGNSSVDSLCDADGYVCRCFSYTFMESQMIWTELEGNVVPPNPPKDEGIPAPGEAVIIKVDAYPDSANTYRYTPLPFGLFGSDGTSISKFVFQIRGNDKIAATGCLDVCGAAAPPAETPAEE